MCHRFKTDTLKTLRKTSGPSKQVQTFYHYSHLENIKLGYFIHYDIRSINIYSSDR